MADQQRGRWGPLPSLLIVAALAGPALLLAQTLGAARQCAGGGCP